MNVTYKVSLAGLSGEKALASVSVRAFLRQKCGFSHGLWRRLKWNGTLLVNGEEVRATTAVVRDGDVVTCRIAESSSLAATPMPLDIRYEDEYMIVLNKPAGMLVHPTGGDYDNTLGNGLLHYYRRTGQEIDFHPVHRLDRNTTGLVLVAKQPQLQNALTQGNGGKFFHRSYVAVIEGEMPLPAGTIDLPIARHPDSIIQRICSPEGQVAVTHYRTLARRGGRSLLWLELETGRTHQIRVHLAAMGHPLLGDDLYGGDTSVMKRQALHAVHLEAENPLTGESISIYSDVPQDMRDLFWGH
ncbi:MAG: RluA family pseudouridine synthase [Anaerovibrio slackiae]|uniref:RluA family pseudouridine synthase n=1 Tax=Anaerovibrio slackiae TaxID=2652309 RepID=UPI0023F349C5|nr:RluA family pseudouridine synthase [Anaerovibrio slackiae]MDD6164415.1 RluA family pseudouridine synthase [Anaerovibrio slackiae]